MKIGVGRVTSCHSARSGTVSQMQSATQSFSVDHMMLFIRIYDNAGNVIETHEHVGEFKEW